MIRLGVAGVGWLGEALIKDVLRVPGVKVAAVQDIRIELAQTMARRYDVPWAGDRFDDLIAHAGLDAVVICTPNAFHAPQAQAALRSGKHVLVQKPLALTLAQAQATIDAAAQCGRLLFVDYSYRFLETMAVFRKTLAGSKVQSAQAVFHNIYGPGTDKAWFFDPRLSGGGALMDLGVHLLDLGLWLLNPHCAQLEQVNLSGAGSVEDAAALRLRLGDVPFQLQVSWNAPLAETKIAFEVVVDNGQLVCWENVAGSFFRFRTVREGDVLLDRETTLREDTLRAFVHAIRSGVAPPVETQVYALLDRAYRQGRRLTLDRQVSDVRVGEPPSERSAATL